jgi:pimeloyl-ACP methyl ester carboxylesterase
VAQVTRKSSMQYIRNKILTGSDNRPFLLDVFFPDITNHCTVVFVHGFKGFKDWGCWDKVAQDFANNGFTFAKFNFSHNGTDINSPIDFVDLETFGQNNYSHELFDLNQVLNFLLEDKSILDKVGKTKKLILIGHSRGGGISLIKACIDKRIDTVVTWASVASLEYSWPDADFINTWKMKGVYHIRNSRTNQDMPLYYQFYEDFLKNKEKFSMSKNLPKLNIPVGIFQGNKDPAISVASAERIHSLCPNSELCIIDGADHVFGANHPFTKEELPKHIRYLVDKSQDFIKTH